LARVEPIESMVRLRHQLPAYESGIVKCDNKKVQHGNAVRSTLSDRLLKTLA